MENLISKIQVGGTDYGVVPPAGLTEEQQAQVRQNIGAISSSEADVVRDGTYPDMTVGEATHSQNADAAINATNSTNAVNAQSATQATNAANAAQASKLSNARAIDGVNFDGTAGIVHYGVCSTAAGTTAETVSLAGFTLVAGARITVKFTTANTVSSPTLNVNGTGEKDIKADNSITDVKWPAGAIMEFLYDGTDWLCIAGYKLSGKPVGTHHIQYNGESTPAALFGGTWSIDTDYAGRVLVGSGTGYTLGATGGSADAVVVAHTHNASGVNESAAVSTGNFRAIGRRLTDTTANNVGLQDCISSSGVSGVGKNMQPYKVVAVWKRTA